MNKILNILLLSLIALFATGCGKEVQFPMEDEGQLSIKKMIVKIENEENVVRSSVDVGSFIVEICTKGVPLLTYTYAEMPEVITLGSGVYTLNVRSGEEKDVAWDEPYFEGTTQFEVKPKEITEVETVECALANVRVSVIFDDSLLPALSDDASVKVEMGDGASVEFSKNETRSAYFAYIPGSETMVATFSGDIDGDHHEELRAYTDVKPGNHYKITFAYRNAHIPGNEGTISFTGLLVDAFVEEESLVFNVDDDDPLLEDSERPGEGGSTPPDNPPTPGDGPTITLPTGSEIDLNGNIVDAEEGKNYSLDVSSDTGFTVFKVDIISPYLTDEFMQGINFTTHLDFINPGQYEATYKNFGLPCNVGGSKHEVFDISGLVPLLSLADEQGQVHEFRLTVGDASGSVTKVLRFRNL